MIDPSFIEEQIAAIQQANELIQLEFGQLSMQQLNWKLHKKSWSIGQCIDHLLTTNQHYLPVLNKATAPDYKMTFWERKNFFRQLFGKMVVQQMEEANRKKVNAPRLFLPEKTTIYPNVLERFEKQQQTFIDYISLFREKDVDQLQISSPVLGLLTFSVRHGILMLTNHHFRHIRQARAVKNNKDFPIVVF